MTINSNSTIAEAKNFLRANFNEGVKCPCCTQLVKLYQVKINTGMIIVLINMYKLNKRLNKEWVHPIKDLKTINGDYAKLRFWDLVVSSSDEPDEDKKANGYWRITEKGKDFVENKIRIYEKVKLYDNKSYGNAGRQVNIYEAIKNKFNFKELMES